jgi:hypothetical protein
MQITKTTKIKGENQSSTIVTWILECVTF